MTAGHDTRDRGVALLLALVVLGLLAGFGLSLTLLGDTDRRIAANLRSDDEAWYAAHGAVDRAAADLAGLPDWDPVLAGLITSAFAESTHQPTLPWSGTLNLDALTADLQSSSAGSGSFGANTPVWRLFAWGPIRQMAPGGGSGGPYVVAWVADDVSESDGNASDDGNNVVMVHADAFGTGGAKRSVEAVVARAGVGIRIVARRDL